MPVNLSTRRLTFCALFAALLCVFSQLSIPLPGGVPINLALLAVYLCALLMPLKLCLFSIGAFLLLGVLGAPVFAGFRGGPSVLFGKTGGYLMGYLLCGGAVSLLAPRARSFAARCLIMLLGLFLCYAFGTAWFVKVSGLTLPVSLGYCVYPFLPGDAVKILAAALLAPRLAPVVKQYVG